MTIVDLKDMYFMIPIHSEDRSVLWFSAHDCYFQFTCLLFSILCTPWIFTKTPKPITSLLKKLDTRPVVSIDSMLVMAESQQLARDHALWLVFLLENLDFTVHPEKTVMTPSQEIEILGVQVHS